MKTILKNSHSEAGVNGVIGECYASDFATGKGVVTLSAEMSDEQILAFIKAACTWSKGKAFQVIPPEAR